MLDEIHVNPDLILATDIVFDGNPYADFVKVVTNLGFKNDKLKVMVIMPSKEDRMKCDDFINLMVKDQVFKHDLVELG